MVGGLAGLVAGEGRVDGRVGQGVGREGSRAGLGVGQGGDRGGIGAGQNVGSARWGTITSC